MRNLKLDSDEGIIQQTSYVERYQVEDKCTEIDEMYLTNKNLILLYEESKGNNVVEKISLDDIRIIKNKAQIFKVDDSDYGLGMQIILKDGSRSHFVFEKDKEIVIWINAIIETLIEEGKDLKNLDSTKQTKDELEEEKIPKKLKFSKSENKVEPTSEFLTDLMGVMNSTKETIKNATKQVSEEFAKANTKSEVNDKPSDNEIHCSNCGKKVDSRSKYCNFCGELINESKKEEKVEEDVINTPKKTNDNSNDTIYKNKKFDDEELTERKVVYDGKVHKCPNCGEVIKSFVAICPACGYEVGNKNISNSLQDFINKVTEIEEAIDDSGVAITGWSSWGNMKKFGWIILNLAFFFIPLVIYCVLPLVSIKKPTGLGKEEKKLQALIENFSFPNDRESIIAALLFMKEKVSFIARKPFTRKNIYWINLWSSKALQLKQRADLLFPNDPIVNQSYEIIKVDEEKANKEVKKKAGIGTIILVVAIILLMFIAFNSNSGANNYDENATFSWQTNGLFALIPEPATNNGKIISETDKRINIELYHISSLDFENYVKACREKGFNLEITKNDSVFYSKNEKGYDLDIFYYENEERMEIYLDSYSVIGK